MRLTRCDVCRRILEKSEPRYSLSVSAVGRTMYVGGTFDLCEKCYVSVRRSTFAHATRIRVKEVGDAD